MTDTFISIPEVAILLSGAESDYAVANSLMQTGLMIYVCANTQELISLLRSGKRPVAMADATQARELEIYALKMLLYTTTPAGSLVFRIGNSTQSPESHERNEFDVSDPPSKADLLSLLRTVHRQVSAAQPIQIAAAPKAEVQWTLVNKSRSLRAPNGAQIHLTVNECLFVTQLFQTPMLNKQWQTVSQSGADYGLHNVAVLVSRLRHKIQDSGVTFPLKVIRGRGYQFTADCAILDDVGSG